MSRNSLIVMAMSLIALSVAPSSARGQMTMPMPTASATKPAAPAKKKTTVKKKGATSTPAKRGRASKKHAPSGTHHPAMQMHDGMASMPMHDPTHAMMQMHDSAHRSMSMRDSMPGMAMDSAHRMPMSDSMKSMSHKHDATPGMSPGMPGMTMGAHTDSSSMSGMPAMSADAMMIGPLGVSMDRMGSGTTWIPDAVTMPSRRTMMGGWMVMAHGFAFAQYDKQTGKRGDEQFGSLNWAMVMATRDLAGGRFQARTMLSLDALGVTARGYPLLLQTGEAYRGEPLHDRQHPHDLFMELGALYQRQFTNTLGWSVYAAPSGEPALGPVAFMHRPSAMDNPSAPIGHHWQDATHVSFGVLTGGLFTKRWQIEASVFNGKEPDDRRWNFDPIRLDSYSSRVTFNPDSSWSFTSGYGYLKRPEILHPEESMHRVTASVLHGITLGADGQVASALIWGANKHSTGPDFSHSVLAESEAILDRRNTIFGRAEFVQKNAEELVVDGISGSASSSGASVGFPSMQKFNVGTLELGYIREVARTHWATFGIGAAGTLNFVPSPLETVYGSRNPKGLMVFLRLRPFHERASAGGMHGMHMGAADHH